MICTAIWYDKISFAEAINQMQNIVLNQEDNLALFYNYDEGFGEVLIDLSINGYDGLIVEADWSNDVPNIDFSGSLLASTSLYT